MTPPPMITTRARAGSAGAVAAGSEATLDLAEIPLGEGDDVVLALPGVGARGEGGAHDAGMVLLTEMPVLLTGQLPEGKDPLHLVVATLDGILVDQPLNLYP